MRDLGNAGEAKIQEWCSLAGITVNKAGIDRHGWDLFFEMSNQFDLTTAAGLHEPDYECKVQVKSTDGGVKSLPIELSNLRAMATTSLPSFYLLLDYGGGDSPKSAHLLHIDDGLCEKILGRIRSETAKSKSVKLNKKKMSLGFETAVSISPLNGAGLKAAIVSSIGASQSSYVKRKQQHLASVGFGSDAYSVKFQIDNNDMQQFVAMALGDKARVPVKEFKTFLTRFGIKEELPIPVSDTAMVSITDAGPTEYGRIVFKNKISGTKSEWEATVLRGALGVWIPEQYRTLRLRAGKFSMDIGNNLKSFKFSVDEDESSPCGISELRKFYQLMSMFESPSDIAMSIFIQGHELKARLGGEGLRGGFDQALLALKAAQRVQEEFDNYDEILISPSELSSKQYIIRNYLNFISERDGKVSARLTFKVVDQEIESAECLIPLILVMGNKCFASLCVLSGDLAQQSEGSYVLDVTRQRQTYKTYCDTDLDSLKHMAAELQEQADRYEGTVTVVDLTSRYTEPLIESFDNSELFAG